ncbi:hypothetical protein D3C87_1718050 [compost metagenome]
MAAPGKLSRRRASNLSMWAIRDTKRKICASRVKDLRSACSSFAGKAPRFKDIWSGGTSKCCGTGNGCPWKRTGTLACGSLPERAKRCSSSGGVADR